MRSRGRNNETTKFWEELIAYIPLIRHGEHRGRRVQLRGLDTQTEKQSHKIPFIFSKQGNKLKIEKQKEDRKEGKGVYLGEREEEKEENTPVQFLVRSEAHTVGSQSGETEPM